MSNIDFIVDFRDGAYLEITGKTNELFVVDFYDLDTGILEFTQTARVGSWLRTEKKHYVNWHIIDVFLSDLLPK